MKHKKISPYLPIPMERGEGLWSRSTTTTMASPRPTPTPPTTTTPPPPPPPSSTIQFVGLLKQPDPIPDSTLPFELDESDVFWFSSNFSDSGNAHSPPAASNSPTTTISRHNSGLSAALSEDHPPLVRRKPPAMRTIPAVTSTGTAARKYRQSAPMNVPVWPTVKKLGNFEEDAGGEDWEEEEMVPPHEIVARSHVTTFSVFEGVGRTLKGRDLRRVRNAVFQQTGFI